MINRRDFLKVIAIAIGTAAATKIPLNIPYKLPYWRDLIEAGRTYQIVFRWDKYGENRLTVDGVECDPGKEFTYHEDGSISWDVFNARSPQGTLLYNYEPRGSNDWMKNMATISQDKIQL